MRLFLFLALWNELLLLIVSFQQQQQQQQQQRQVLFPTTTIDSKWLTATSCRNTFRPNTRRCRDSSGLYYSHIKKRHLSYGVVLHMSASSSSIITRQQPLFTQVVSDVDDTLKSSGGVNVGGIAFGGIDVQYDRGEIYPGVGEFMVELSRHGLSTADKQNPAKIAILTARAEEFKGALEIKQQSKLAISLRKAGENVGIQNWGIGPVLYGSVAEWIIQDRKGLRKFTNFERLIQQDPTGMIFQYVYVGDVGELDQEAGETMLREYPEVVKAVFLHVVSDQLGVSPIIPAPKLINGRPLVFFRTYVGAAVDAVQLGFMDLNGLKTVIQAATDKLANVPETSSKRIDIQKDIARAEILLQDAK